MRREMSKEAALSKILVEGEKLVIGWREWIALPSLNIPMIKAKVDSGAKTSALHAFHIQPFTERGAPHVRFFVHPIQRRHDIRIECKAEVIDHRVISDSGGHRERRYVIEVPVNIGGILYPIELTLANRDTMTFRMLFGRAAMKPFILDADLSYVLGKPVSPSRAYKQGKKGRK